MMCNTKYMTLIYYSSECGVIRLRFWLNLEYIERLGIWEGFEFRRKCSFHSIYPDYPFESREICLWCTYGTTSCSQLWRLSVERNPSVYCWVTGDSFMLLGNKLFMSV